MAEYAVGCNGVNQYLLINDGRIDLDQGETLIWLGTLEEKPGEQYHYILSTGAYTSSNFNAFYDQVSKKFRANKFNDVTTVASFPNILTGTPHLVAAQRDTGNETYAIVCEAGGTAEYLEIATNSSQTVPVPWYIMRRGDHSTDRYAKGQTHMMAFFSAATDLSQADIEAIAAGADPTAFGGILLNWPMNEGTGTTTTDTLEDPGVVIDMYNMPLDESHWVLLSGAPAEEYNFTGTMALGIHATAAMHKTASPHGAMPLQMDNLGTTSKIVAVDAALALQTGINGLHTKLSSYSATFALQAGQQAYAQKSTDMAAVAGLQMGATGTASKTVNHTGQLGLAINLVGTFNVEGEEVPVESHNFYGTMGLGAALQGSASKVAMLEAVQALQADLTGQHSKQGNMAAQMRLTIDTSASMTKTVIYTGALPCVADLLPIASKSTELAATMAMQLDITAVFFNSTIDIDRFVARFDGQVVLQRFDGATVQQRFDGVLKQQRFDGVLQ